jgi:predicted peptidase
MKRLLSTPAGLMIFLMTVLSVVSGDGRYAGAMESTKHIKGVTAVTEVFEDGQKVSTVAIEYDRDVVNERLDKTAFSVEGRTVEKVYANSKPDKASGGIDGRYVIIELVKSQTSSSGQGGGQGGGMGFSSGRGNGTQAAQTPLKASVTQVGEVAVSGGEKYPPETVAVESTKTVNLVVDDFKQFEFKDTATGKILRYNLFIPKNYDKKKSYPMVQFIHDGSVTSTDTTATIKRCIGAVIWATPSEQAKHECFVLAPQYDSQTVNDNSEYTDYLDITVNLINYLTGQYSIDKNRIYTTGQSMGCMLSIAINIKYPDLFAASMLVAGQWGAELTRPMYNKELWIIVAEGDTKAFPGMNASAAVWEAAGAKISRATWSARASEAEKAANVKKMLAEDTNIKYAVFEKGTVFPEGQQGGMEHMASFPKAYSIEGVRDWLFTQKK